MTGMIDKAPNPELAAEECWRPLGPTETLLLEAQLEQEGMRGQVAVGVEDVLWRSRSGSQATF